MYNLRVELLMAAFNTVLAKVGKACTAAGFHLVNSDDIDYKNDATVLDIYEKIVSDKDGHVVISRVSIYMMNYVVITYNISGDLIDTKTLARLKCLMKDFKSFQISGATMTLNGVESY